MCLYIKGSKFPKIAKDDIIVYKYFSKYWLKKNNSLISPIMGYDYGKFEYSKVIKAKGLNWEAIKFIFKGRVEGGFIHCYKSNTVGDIKCIIPKGTLYYEGMDGELCARKLFVYKN
jgi:hypothetical protein